MSITRDPNAYFVSVIVHKCMPTIFYVPMCIFIANQTGVNVFPNHVTGDSQEQLFPKKVKEVSSLSYPSGTSLAKTCQRMLGFCVEVGV